MFLYAGGVFILWSRIGDIRLILFSVSFLVVNSFKCDWYFLGKEKFAFITLRSLIVRLLGLCSIFILIHQPADYYIYYAIITVSAVVASLWNNAILLKEVKISLAGTNWKRHIKFVWVTYLITLFYSVPLMLDNVFLRLVNTASVVGLYSFSTKMVRMSATLLTDSFLVFFPRIAFLASQNEGEQLQQKLLLNIRLVILLSVPMSIGLYFIADDLTIVLFGDKFLAASIDLRLLAPLPFLKSLSLFFSNSILLTHQKERIFLRNLRGGAILFVCSSIVLGYYFNDAGACVALMIFEVFLIIANYFSIKSEFPNLIVYDSRTMGQALLGSLLFLPLVYFLKWKVDSHLGKLITCIAGSVLLYFLFLFFIARNSMVTRFKDYALKFFVKKADRS